MISINTDMKRMTTTISVEQQSVEVPGILQQLLDYPNCYVILLGDKEVSNCPDNNIYAIGKDGTLMWNIKDVLEQELGNRKDMWYPQMDVTAEGLSVLSFSGVRYLIDVEQGTCIRKQVVR